MNQTNAAVKKYFTHFYSIFLISRIGISSSVCDIHFENEVAFKDHFLATIHNCGLPSEGKLGRQGKLQSQIF